MDLIKKMLSIPPELPLTSTQSFTFISAFLAYFIAGLTMTFAPDLWNMILHMDFGAGGRGFFILVGSGMVDIGLCLVVLARNKASQVPNAGPLLVTVFNRLVLVNGVLIVLYSQGILNARFAGMISALDSTLAIVTYVIWAEENTDSSLIKFFQHIWSAISRFSLRPHQYAIFQLLGFVQLIVSLTAPSILLSSGIVPSSIVGRHAEGLFRVYFVIVLFHALFHVLAADSQNYAIASVFYRLTWNIPVFLVLGLTAQISAELAKTFVMYDVMFILLQSRFSQEEITPRQKTTVLHTCKNGQYDSTEVTYKYNSDPGKMYEADNIYIFFNNGDDGRASTLSSKEAKCTMLFAVNVTDNKRAVYGMNFDKAALTGTKNCKLSSCPRSSITPSVVASPATIPVITSTTTPTTTTSTTTSTTPMLSGPQGTEVAPNSTKIIGSAKPAATQKPNSPVPCTDNWLNVTIFIVAIIGAFLAGMFSIVFVFALKIALNKKVRKTEPESLTLENLHRFSANGKESSPYGSPRQTEVCHDEGQKAKEKNQFIDKL
ncbi:Hypothetical predicted protein [Paramuricea clavata]|uniref:Uncharacterized protein n=1 Tax=Paramuricea clavata TaxID=317549 RepID=A0A6S7H7N4_PARCT|nr:Hypothetical predicted protein [Paramuricea clavata]